MHQWELVNGLLLTNKPTIKDGSRVRNQCQSLLHWNKALQTCDAMIDAKCTVGDPSQAEEQPTFGDCSGAGTRSDAKECSIYYNCRHNQWLFAQCPSGFHYNNISGSCESLYTAGCTILGSTFGQCTGTGTTTDQKECFIYYKCTNSQWIRTQCQTGFHYNKAKGTCESMNTAGCTILGSSWGSCSGTGTTSDAKDCSIYYKCTNGQWIRSQCQSGFHYNSTKRTCEAIATAGCSRPG